MSRDVPVWVVRSTQRIVLALAIVGVALATRTSLVGATPPRSVPWASLGQIHPVLVQPAGWGSPIAAQPTSASYGSCSSTGVVLSLSSIHTTLIPDGAVASMLARVHLGLHSSPGTSRIVVNCNAVALDPTHPQTVYVGFQAAEGNSIPPVYDVALVTRNLGKSWQWVPPPRGYALSDFAGFVERSHGVDVLFARNVFFPLRPGQTTTFVAVESPGVNTNWLDVHLGCPSGSPCVIFGPQAPQGACSMSEWQQSVLEGALAHGRGPTPWRAAGDIPSVSQCGSQQLVTTSARDEFLLDRSRADALAFTHDGTHWSDVSLPAIGGARVGGRVAYLGQVMTLDAHGALVLVAGSALVTSEHLEMLTPRSQTWCATTVTLPAATKSDPVSALQSTKTLLVVQLFTPLSIAHHKTKDLTFPLSALKCRREGQ